VEESNMPDKKASTILMEVRSGRDGPEPQHFEPITAFEQVFLDSTQKYGEHLTYKSGQNRS
jgi:hypothetical protein